MLYVLNQDLWPPFAIRNHFCVWCWYGDWLYFGKFLCLAHVQSGAAAVFLDFISYSGGPTPEELLMEAPCPVSVLWGAQHSHLSPKGLGALIMAGGTPH